MTTTRRRPKHLFNLRPEEISLVDEGANGKRILITKRRDETPMPNTPRRQSAASASPQDAVKKRMAAQPSHVLRKIEKGIKAHVQKRAKIRKDLLSDEANAPDAGMPLSDEAQAALQAAARIVQPYAGEINQDDLDYIGEMVGVQESPDDPPPAGPDPLAGGVEKDADDEDGAPEDKDTVAVDADKVADDDPPPDADADPDDDSGDEDDDPGEMDDDDPASDNGDDADPDVDADAGDSDPINIAIPADAPDGVEDDDHSAAADAARAAYVSTLESTGYKVTKNRVTKRAPRNDMPTQMQATLARIEKRAAQSEKVIKSLTERLEAETALRQDAEYQARAQREFRHIGEPEKVAKSLRKVRKNLGDEAADELEDMLKAANAQIQKSAAYGGDLFSELGTSRAGNTADSGEGRIESMAEEVVQKAVGSGQDKRSRSQIYRDVLKSKDGRQAYARATAGR